MSQAAQANRTIVDVDGLVDAMLSNRPPVILDVRWQLPVPGAEHIPGTEKYRAGHIPGAVYVDLDTELAAPATAELGRHPLPDVADLRAAARRWGIDNGSPVVIYDDTANLAAARAWWLLRWGGLTDVRLLDGGFAAWERAGMRVSTGSADPRPGSVQLSGGAMGVADLAQVVAISEQLGGDTSESSVALLDARAAERYRGEMEPVDAQAGHIPGARNVPTGGNLTPTGEFLAAEDLAARFAAFGATPDAEVTVYCGSGINAAHEIAALEVAGVSATLFPGSWSAYSAHPDLPVATGDE